MKLKRAINNYLLESYKEQNLQNLSFQNINPVTLSINNNTNINHQSNPATTATLTTNTFCTKKPTSILHTKTHAGEKAYKCSYQDCDKKFTKKYNLQCHIRIHTGEKPYKCTECSKAFIQKNNLQNHIRTHTGEKPYKCTDINCDKAFSIKSNLVKHIKAHTGEKPYKCTNKDCDKAFSHSYALTAHIRTHTGEKPYKCTECSKAFCNQANVTKHIRIHTGEKPYKCIDINCDKAFSIKSNLIKHIRVHTGEKPYKCTNKDCDQEFSQSSALTAHIRTHTGEKPFKCPECKKKFNQKNSLKRHIRTLHPLKEILTYKKQPLKSSYHQSDNTFKQNECFKDNNLQKEQSLIVDLEPINVFKDVPKIAAEIIATPEINATSEDEIMIIKTEPIDYEYNQRSFFKRRSYEHKIDNTLPILQDPNNPSKSILQDKLKWFKKFTYQNFLDLQYYIITKSSIKDYKITKSQPHIIKILKKIKQLIDWSTLELHMHS